MLFLYQRFLYILMTQGLLQSQEARILIRSLCEINNVPYKDFKVLAIQLNGIVMSAINMGIVLDQYPQE